MSFDFKTTVLNERALASRLSQTLEIKTRGRVLYALSSFITTFVPILVPYTSSDARLTLYRELFQTLSFECDDKKISNDNIRRT